MLELFSTLTQAVHATAPVALGAAFVWGLLSILLSPCHLASIPLIVGFIGNQETQSTRRAFWLSTLFATGILVTIGLVGVVTAALGRMLGDVGPYGNYFVAAVFLIVGLHLLGAFDISCGGARADRFSGRGLWGALLLGLIFGIALGPCTFAFLAPVLAVSLESATTNPPFAAGMLLIYGMGHCSVIVVAGTSTELVQRYLNWNQSSRGSTILRKVCGALVILGGIYMMLKP